MTTQLKAVPDLEETAIEWADNCSALASSLRDGEDATTLRQAALACARESVRITEALIVLLEAEE